MAPSTFVVVGLILIWFVATGRAKSVLDAARGGGTVPPANGGSRGGTYSSPQRTDYPEVAS